MIFGIGVDLCDVPRYLEISAKFKGAFEKRLCTAEEMEHWRRDGEERLENLAVLFAGKEALIKALGETLKEQVYGYHDFQILFHPEHLTAKYSERLTEKIFGKQQPDIFISHSQTSEYAVVFVIVNIEGDLC